MNYSLIVKNTFFQIFARTVTAFIGFLITVIIARNYPITEFGDYIKITAYVTIFYLVIDFGLNAIFLQYKNAKFKNIFYLRIAISVIIYVLLNFAVFLLPYNKSLGSGFSESMKLTVLLFSLTVFFQGIIFSSTAIFQKTLSYHKYLIGAVIGALTSLMLVVVISYLNFPIFYVFLSLVISSIVTASILLFLTKEKIMPIFLDLSFAKDIIIKSFPLGLMLIFNLIYFRIDMILLSILVSPKDVAVYGLSYKFFDFLIALPLFLSNAIYPFLIKEKNNFYNLFKLIKKYFFIFITLSIIVMIPFWFISPLFTFIKSEFAISIVPFRILLLSLPLFFATSFLQWVLITLEKQKFLMYSYFFAASLNILLNIYFIPKYSYIASSYITLVSELLIFTLLLYKMLTIKKLHEKGVQIHG